MVRIFSDRFSSSTSCSGWLHETEPGRPDPAVFCLFLKVVTHPLIAAGARKIEDRGARVRFEKDGEVETFHRPHPTKEAKR